MTAPGRRRRRGPAGGLPPVGIVEILSVDADGFAEARPMRLPAGAAPPAIRLAPDSRPGRAVAAGDRVLARLTRRGAARYSAEVIHRLPEARPRRVLGIYDPAGGGRLRPTDRRVRHEIRVARRDAMGARAGELVRAEIGPGRGAGPAEARVLERLGAGEPWRTASLVAVEGHGIPDRFAQAALDEAAAARAAPADGREDLRSVPLATIDDEEARDFDDAVWAAPDADPGNPGGFRLVVAIADVAWYVRPGSALDAAARERGNSVYFPDRVVPMLPEALSNGWCSLQPGQDRPCLAVHMRIDAEGNLRSHRFARALMRSAARLTYRCVQEALDGGPAPAPGPGIAALGAAGAALARARARRGTLELDIPERRVVMAAAGGVEAVERRRTLPAHRLIEDLMIAANTAAAETLERRGRLCVYRVHEAPDAARVAALRTLLDGMGLALPRGARLRPHHFTRLLERAAGHDGAALLHEAVLRTQAQAVYGLDNLGHFGLGLARYCHFTSPIRRYADLLVHRALLAALGLGAGGAEGGREALGEAARHVSATERRAAAAEREAVDRLCAVHLRDRAGAAFAARVSGITRAGLFLRLEETGAEALAPASLLPGGPVRVDASGFQAADRSGRTVWRLGQKLTARLREIDVVTGSILCAVAGDDGG